MRVHENTEYSFNNSFLILCFDVFDWIRHWFLSSIQLIFHFLGEGNSLLFIDEKRYFDTLQQHKDFSVKSLQHIQNEETFLLTTCWICEHVSTARQKRSPPPSPLGHSPPPPSTCLMSICGLTHHSFSFKIPKQEPKRHRNVWSLLSKSTSHISFWPSSFYVRPTEPEDGHKKKLISFSVVVVAALVVVVADTVKDWCSCLQRTGQK